MIVEYKYATPVGNVWRRLFAYSGEEISPEVAGKVDSVVLLSRSWDVTPAQAARDHARTFDGFCEFCRVVDDDAEPHPRWQRFW